MFTYEQLIKDKTIWSGEKAVNAKCSWCESLFEIKYGTLYNAIRRNADGIFCSRKCSGSHQTSSTQKKLADAGGKACKRCGEFKILSEFSSLPNPPYYRAECKGCHNYKPARKYFFSKEKAKSLGVDFDISLDYFLKISNSECFYCSENNKKIIRAIRINEEDGFKDHNVIPACVPCKKFRGSISHEKFINNCEKITKNIKRAIRSF